MMMLFLFISFSFAVAVAAGVAPNMTENETRILPYCYLGDSLFIAAINQTCSQIYGGPVD